MKVIIIFYRRWIRCCNAIFFASAGWLLAGQIWIVQRYHSHPMPQRYNSYVPKITADQTAKTVTEEGKVIPTVLDHTTSSPSQRHKSKHAYAFLMAGCQPTDITDCAGYVYNILVAEYILRLSGSTSDIVVMVRMATSSSTDEDDTRLPPDVVNILGAKKIIIKYLKMAKVDNFYTAQMAKFDILDLVEYDRVLFLDADVMPRCNLDYMFHLSEGLNPPLQENAILAWTNEPAAGGFFMLKPNHTDYLQNLEIQMKRLLHQGENFDIIKGWGHVIEPPDQWNSRNYIRHGTKWDFYGGSCDQGLLYHWVKYVKKKVSIINYKKVETWSSLPLSEASDAVQMIRSQSPTEIFGKGCSSSLPTYQLNWEKNNHFPYSDFTHFTGDSKPWKSGKVPPARNETVFEDAVDFWFHILRKVVEENNLEVDVDQLQIQTTALGEFPEDEHAKLAADAEIALNILD